MSENLRLGRIGGVAIGINWSVLVIFLLVVSGLAMAQFPAVYPQVDRAWHIAAAFVAGVVFFASLLAHEVSHAVVAARNGVEVDGIVLWMFGGIARLQGEPPDAGAQFRIAVVGPLVSFLLGGVFLAGAVLVQAAGVTGTAAVAVGALRWLGAINLVLAIFNLMPAAPLDGGRVLRAALWRWRGDKLQAAVTAARAGKVFGFLLIGLGLYQFAATGLFGGLWLVFIGWFLITAAGAEEQDAKIRGALSDVQVSDVMSRDPLSVSPDLSVDQFIREYVFRERFSTYPLMQEGRLHGLVSVNRIRDVPEERRGEVRVADVACAPDDIPTARPDEPLPALLERMSGCSDGRALVVDNDRVVGIVSPSDIARRLQVADLRDSREREQV